MKAGSYFFEYGIGKEEFLLKDLITISINVFSPFWLQLKNGQDLSSVKIFFLHCTILL